MIGITLPWSHMPSWCEQGQLSWHTHPDTHTHTHITNTEAGMCTCTHLNTQNTGRKLTDTTKLMEDFFFSIVNGPNVPSRIGLLYYLRNIVCYFQLLFQFAMSWDLRIWLQYIAIHVRFILTTLKKKEGVWNCFLLHADMHHILQTHCLLHVEFLLAELKILHLESFFPDGIQCKDY